MFSESESFLSAICNESGMMIRFLVMYCARGAGTCGAINSCWCWQAGLDWRTSSGALLGRTHLSGCRCLLRVQGTILFYRWGRENINIDSS